MYGGINMSKIFTLECKGEVIAMLKHNEIGYMDFIKACKDIEEKAQTKDLYTVKAMLVQEYGFEELLLQGGYEVVKKKGMI